MRTSQRLMMGATALLVSIASVPAEAQQMEQGWGLNRFGAHLGTSWVTQASQGFEVGAQADIGWLVDRQARVLIGVNYLGADVDRRIDGAPVGGSFRDLTLSSDLQLQILRVGQITPYVGAGLGLHFLSERNIPDQNVRDIYDGLVVGLNYFAGMLWDLTPDRRWSATGEIRGVAAQNLGRTSFRLGASYRFGPPAIPGGG